MKIVNNAKDEIFGVKIYVPARKYKSVRKNGVVASKAYTTKKGSLIAIHDTFYSRDGIKKSLVKSDGTKYFYMEDRTFKRIRKEKISIDGAIGKTTREITEVFKRVAPNVVQSVIEAKKQIAMLLDSTAYEGVAKILEKEISRGKWVRI